jgi:H(+)-transporting ATP synthase subunit D
VTIRAATTRSNLVRLRRRLEQVEKGAALLRRKRESLVAALFERARPAIDSRQRIDEQAQTAWRALLTAFGTHGRDELRAVGWPSRTLRVELAPIEVWGLHAVELARPPQVVRSLGARAVVPEAGPVAGAKAFEELLELMLDVAPKEYLMRRLGHELSRATRLVNTLEQRVATGLHHELSHIRRTLEEREREEHLRLKRLIARRKAERHD